MARKILKGCVMNYDNKDALIAERLDEMMRGDSDVGKK